MMANYHKNVAILLASILLAYLTYLNFSIPYVTVDEIRSMSMGYLDHIRNVASHGRVSFIFSALSNTVIGFADPTILNLLPRFLSMLLMAYAIYLAVVNAGVSKTSSLIVASIVMLTHQLDDWHNGLIAFFSGYALAYGSFVLSIAGANFKINKYFRFLTQFTFSLISFLSEIFFGLTVFYLLFNSVIYRRRVLLQNPLVYSLITYLVLAILFNLGNHNPEHAAMTHYLAGAYTENSVLNIGKAFLLYMFYSLPFASASGLGFGAAVAAGGIAILVILLLLFILVRDSLKISSAEIHSGISLVVCLSLMGIGCEMLVANQPLKYNWIMSGASSRYVFSLYTWVGFAIPLAILLIRRFSHTAKIVALVFSLVYCGYAVFNNVHYIQGYSQSLKSWKKIHHLAKSAPENGTVDIPLTLLKHPGIVQFGPQELSDYIYANYHKSIAICYDGARINFSSEVNDKQVGINGFSGPEFDGRWTLGPLADVQVRQQLFRGNVLKIYFSDSYADNADLNSEITFEEKKINRVIKKGDVVELTLTQDQLNPIVYIKVPHPISPDKMGISGDPRNLGLKIQSVEIISDGKKGIVCERIQGH
jgi:hypothetical protein